MSRAIGTVFFPPCFLGGLCELAWPKRSTGVGDAHDYGHLGLCFDTKILLVPVAVTTLILLGTLVRRGLGTRTLPSILIAPALAVWLVVLRMKCVDD